MLNQESEIDDLKKRVSELTDQLNERILSVSKVGSIAEAALIINKVMDAAQLAADQYLENIRALSEKCTADTAHDTAAYCDGRRQPE